MNQSFSFENCNNIHLVFNCNCCTKDPKGNFENPIDFENPFNYVGKQHNDKVSEFYNTVFVDGTPVVKKGVAFYKELNIGDWIKGGLPLNDIVTQDDFDFKSYFLKSEVLSENAVNYIMETLHTLDTDAPVEQLKNLENIINTNTGLTELEKSIIFMCIAVGKSSYEYWLENISIWKTGSYSRKDDGIGDIVKKDIGGAAAGATAAATTALVTGGTTTPAVPVAAVAVGAGASVGKAVEIAVEWFWGELGDDTGWW